ncbi:MAG: PrsW family intramembrane metalloprotease [Micromonosporaceae bacterium]
MIVVRPIPARGRLLDPTLPAFWLAAGLIAVGGWQIGGLIHRAISAYPLPALVALGLFALYAVPFIAAVRTLDFLEEEPPVLLGVGFVWGGVVATSQAISANTAVRNILANLVSPTFADTWSPAISAPVVEEILKASGVLVIVLLAGVQINSTLDGFVYGALVGLGFQVVEDFVYAVHAVSEADRAGSADGVTPVITTFLTRGLLGGLWSHTMFTALAGAGIGYAMTHSERRWGRRIAVAALAFVGAWAFHFVWNTPLLLDGFGFGVGGVLAVVVLKGLPGLLVVLLLMRAALQHEAAYYADLLYRVRDLSLITPDEVLVLVKGRNRLAARRYARSRYGRRAAAAVSRLQRCQARYAVELSRHLDGGVDEIPEAPAARRTAALKRREYEVRDARRRLRALGLSQVAVPTPAPHTLVGVLSVLFGLVGVIVPVGLLVGFGLAGVGLYRARQRRIVPDSWLHDGLMISAIATVLWLLSAVIFDAGGR